MKLGLKEAEAIVWIHHQHPEHRVLMVDVEPYRDQADVGWLKATATWRLGHRRVSESYQVSPLGHVYSMAGACLRDARLYA